MLSKHDLLRKKLKSISKNSSTIVSLAIARIYTCSSINTEEWYDSNLEGIICIVLDSIEMSGYLILYDEKSFQVLFKHEIYKNFSKNYQVIQRNFHCFESNECLIGFKFDSEQDGILFSITIEKLDDQSISNLLNKFKQTNPQSLDKLVLAKKFSRIRKRMVKRINSEGVNYKGLDENINSIEILKLSKFTLLNDFIYDRTKKRFLIDYVSEELKNIIVEIEKDNSESLEKKSPLEIFKKIFIYIENTQNNENHHKKEIKKITFSKILKTKGMDSSETNNKKISQKKISLNKIKRSNSHDRVKEKRYEHISKFIINVLKQKEVEGRNLNLPNHKKIFYQFPKIPNVLRETVQILDNNIYSEDFLASQIQKYKVKQITSELDIEKLVDLRKKSCVSVESIIKQNQRKTLVDYNFDQTNIHKKFNHLESDEDSNEWSD